MPDRKGKSIEYEILQHGDDLLPSRGDGDSAGGDAEERRLKGIQKAAEKLLLLPIRKPETPAGQIPRRKKKTFGNQTGWTSSHPPPLSHSHLFESSTDACCLSLGGNRPRSPLDAIKKPSNYQLSLMSFIEKNDFYCKECNVHLR